MAEEKEYNLEDEEVVVIVPVATNSKRTKYRTLNGGKWLTENTPGINSHKYRCVIKYFPRDSVHPTDHDTIRVLAEDESVESDKAVGDANYLMNIARRKVETELKDHCWFLYYCPNYKQDNEFNTYTYSGWSGGY